MCFFQTLSPWPAGILLFVSVFENERAIILHEAEVFTDLGNASAVAIADEVDEVMTAGNVSSSSVLSDFIRKVSGDSARIFRFK